MITEQLLPARRRVIGVLGTLARLVVGSWMLASNIAAFQLDEWYEPVLGLLVFPAIVLLGQWLRLRYTSTPLRATGPVGYLVNAAIFLALYLTPWYSDRKLIYSILQAWLGSGMLLMIHAIGSRHAPETLYPEPFATRGSVASLQTDR